MLANDATVCTSIAKVKAIRSTHDNLRVRFSFRTHMHTSLQHAAMLVRPRAFPDIVYSQFLQTREITYGGITKHARFICLKYNVYYT